MIVRNGEATMTLLMNYNDPRLLEVAQKIFIEQFKRDPKLEAEMDDRRKKLMYDDVLYNLSHLLTATYYNDKKIFRNYSVWIYELLCHLMKDIDRDRISQQMKDHYEIMAEIIQSDLTEYLSEREINNAITCLREGIDAIEKSVTNVELTYPFREGKYADIRVQYLNALLKSNTKEAHSIIANARVAHVPLVDIYEDILSKTLHEVGELWHKNIITVDREHYATSVTQTIMSSFYDEIFNQPRKEKTMISCAVGSELHEIGVRMLSDIFEYHGWDTVYLGAALPKDSILNSIEEHKPDFIALSVTMVPYLKTCEDIVYAIQKQFNNVKIAVGGRAFTSSEQLWKKWNVDFYADNGKALLEWANKVFDLDGVNNDT